MHRACAELALDEVAQTAVRVDELSRGQPQRHRVDGEVTASEVALESVAVGHCRLARCRVVSVAAIRRDLEDVVALAQPDGAVRDAGFPDVVGPGADDRQDLLRSRVGREVEVLLQPAEQRVADRPADKRDLVSRRREPRRKGVDHRRDLQQRRNGAPLRSGQRRRFGLGGHGSQAYGQPTTRQMITST